MWPCAVTVSDNGPDTSPRDSSPASPAKNTSRFKPHNGEGSVSCSTMSRNYDYDRKRITQPQQRRHDRNLILTIVIVGLVILGTLFYLIATK